MKKQVATERQQFTAAGDSEGLQTDQHEDFESVAELVLEGQDLEAEQIEGIAQRPIRIRPN